VQRLRSELSREQQRLVAKEAQLRTLQGSLQARAGGLCR
jgi:hypothetical protein